MFLLFVLWVSRSFLQVLTFSQSIPPPWESHFSSIVWSTHFSDSATKEYLGSMHPWCNVCGCPQSLFPKHYCCRSGLLHWPRFELAAFNDSKWFKPFHHHLVFSFQVSCLFPIYPAPIFDFKLIALMLDFSNCTYRWARSSYVRVENHEPFGSPWKYCQSSRSMYPWR